MEPLFRDISTSPLYQLLDDLQQLIQHVLKRSTVRISQHISTETDKSLNKSIVNLAHYLALRELDLRPLQERLAEAGLSSLGRAEPHVLANLINVQAMVSRALGNPIMVKTALPYPDFKEGFDVLAKHADTVLGKSRHQRLTRIMVTLPSEAATDYELVFNLVKEGMDVARINCAHDDIFTWHHMIKQVQRAGQELNSPCRVLMDLAGHKIRTGPVANDPQLLNIKVKRDPNGKLIENIKFNILSNEQHQHPRLDKTQNQCLFPVPKECFAKLANGDRFSLIDARGKKRHIEVTVSPEQGEVSGQCDKSIHLTTQTKIIWQRRLDKSYRDLHSFYFVNLEPTPEKIYLHVGDELVMHKDSAPGQPARYSTSGELQSPAHISCTLPHIIDVLQLGAPVWIDDGKISAYVIKKTADFVVLRISRTGPNGAKLAADKGLNFPETTLNLPALTDKDKQDLNFICKHADMVGFSFVESASDMRALIAELQQRNAGYLPVIAKIETARAVKNLPDILFAGMMSQPLAVMIARGDLAVELGSVRMAEIQEEILWLCEAAHVPVIWATQVLESIAKHGVRSRPEFTDAAMGVRAECVMLNKGPYILDAVRSLNAVLTRMQSHQHKKISRLRALHW